jgi:FMN-dependent NADH-azoreductase
MTTTLFVKANDRSAEHSITVKMYETFLNSYRESHPEDQVVEVDLYKEPLPVINAGLVDETYESYQGVNMDAGGKSGAEVMGLHLEQFLAADKIVIAFPTWNLTVPAVLHMYLDCMHYPGKTFSYSEEGATGLLTDKKAALLNARGGVYDEDSHTEMAVNFVRNTLHFFGITDLTTCIIEGHHEFPDRSEAIIEEGLRKANEAARTF